MTSKNRVFINHIRVSLALMVVQITLGGFVSSGTSVAWLLSVHRYLGYAIALIIVGTAAIARRAELNPTDRRLVWACLATVIVQVVLGIGLTHAQLPLPVVHTHLAVSLILLGLLIALTYRTRRAYNF